MIRVELPAHLRTLAQVDGEVKIDVEGGVTQRSVLDALEARYPMLRGAIRDRISQQRRPFLRFFACEKDLSHEPPDTPLPDGVAAGAEPLLIIGALAGGQEAQLQLHASSESDVTHSLSPEVVMTPSQERKHRGSILIIGNRPASLKLLFTILTEHGYAVHERQLDLESHLRFVRDTLPDLVLVDVRKPGTDGYQVCASLKNNPTTRAIPVIFISAIDRSINQAKALISGAVDYVTDPFDAEEVLWRIQTHISLRRLWENLKSAAYNHGAPPAAPNGDLERAFQEIHVLTQVTGRKHAEEKIRQSSRELKKAEEALKSSERNLAAIINTIPTTAWTTRPDGYCDFLNQVWLDYVGMTAEQAQGWGWGEAIHPDDRNRLVEEWQSCLALGTPVDTEARIRRYDGSYRSFLIRANPLRDEAGNILKWYGTCTDIEDRKKAEEALQSNERNLNLIINTIPTHIYVLNTEGSVQQVNQAVMDYTGLTLEDVQQQDYRDRVIHPDDFKRVRAGRAAALRRGEPFSTEQRVLRNDGEYRWFLVRYRPLLGEQGHIVRWYVAAFDIEDRKRAEQALQQSQVYLNEAQRLAQMGSWAFNAAGFGYWSSELFQIHGLDPKDRPPTIKEYLDLLHPEDREFMQQAIQKMLADHLGCDFTKRIVRPDGKIRHIRWVGVPVADGATFQDFVGTGIDVTEQEELVRKLRQSEADLRTITDAIRQSIVVLAPDGRTLYANRVALDRTGLTLGEANDDGFFTRVFHPDDRDGLLAERQHGLSQGAPFELESRVRQRNGEYRWHLIQYNPLKDEQGQIIRWYSTATDIDDRKQAEARVEQAYLRLAEAQRLSKTGSFISDLLADEHDWSDETFRIFEFDPSTKVTVQMIRNIVHPEDLPTFDAVIARGMTAADLDLVFRIVLPRGAVKHIRGMARVMMQAGGHPLFIGALQDVTESKVAEEALDRARSELAHVARVTTLNALTASIAHEINQPLASLITNASICLRRLDADPPNLSGARETLLRTIRDGNRASDVITRLRALFTKKEFTSESLDLNDATREVIALALNDLQRNRVVLQPELAEDLPPVIGDRIQLQQVTLNLLRNASDAMVDVQDRPRQLLIRTRREADDRVCLSVRDAGCGINPQHFEKLFEPFYTTKSWGMGIGLSVSRSIIEKHQGRLWAEPNDGPGATFSFSIPCAP